MTEASCQLVARIVPAHAFSKGAKVTGKYWSIPRDFRAFAVREFLTNSEAATLNSLVFTQHRAAAALGAAQAGMVFFRFLRVLFADL